MSTSPKTMEQVKSILGKLDQRIDSLRQRRLHGDPAPSPADNTPFNPNAMIPPPPAPIPMPQQTTPSAVPSGPLNPGHPKYGRATPLRNIG